jgi:hypothetical protein
MKPVFFTKEQSEKEILEIGRNMDRFLEVMVASVVFASASLAIVAFVISYLS